MVGHHSAHHYMGQVEEAARGAVRPLRRDSTPWMGRALEPLGTRKAKVNTPRWKRSLGLQTSP